MIRSLDLDDTLEKEMATHHSILAWEITWTEEFGGLQSTGSQRVEHVRAHTHTHKVGIEGNCLNMINICL